MAKYITTTLLCHFQNRRLAFVVNNFAACSSKNCFQNSKCLFLYLQAYIQFCIKTRPFFGKKYMKNVETLIAFIYIIFSWKKSLQKWTIQRNWGTGRFEGLTLLVGLYLGTKICGANTDCSASVNNCGCRYNRRNWHLGHKLTWFVFPLGLFLFHHWL